MRVDFKARITHFFAEARSLMGPDFEDLLDSVHLKTNTNFAALPPGQLIGIMNKLNVTLDSVMRGAVDLELMRQQFCGRGVLAQKYTSQVPYSSRFSTRYMLNYIASRYGEVSARVTMQHFQLTASNFSDVT
jgi:hypothetical protein